MFDIVNSYIPKDQQTLKVIRVARISTLNQDERSLDDQLILLKNKLEENNSGLVQYTDLATQGSGENLERTELRDLEEMIETGEYDLVITEDLARICRRMWAIAICELSEDTGTRLIALNDHVDIGESGWRDSAFISTWHHERSNRDTSDRIKRSLQNRLANGGVLRTPIYGFIKPKGAIHDSKMSKDPEAEKIYNEWFTKLEEGATYSEIADWLNEQEVPLGPDCRGDRWTHMMVSRISQNPILKVNRRLAEARIGSNQNTNIGPFGPQFCDQSLKIIFDTIRGNCRTPEQFKHQHGIGFCTRPNHWQVLVLIVKPMKQGELLVTISRVVKRIDIERQDRRRFIK